MVPNAYTEHHGTSCGSQSAVCYWCAKLAAEHGWLHWVFEYWGYKWGIGFRTPCLGLNHPEDIDFGTASHLSYSSSKWKYTRSISNLMLQNSTFCIQLCVHKHILVHMAQAALFKVAVRLRPYRHTESYCLLLLTEYTEYIPTFGSWMIRAGWTGYIYTCQML